MKRVTLRLIAATLWLSVCGCLTMPAYGWQVDAPTPSAIETKITELNASQGLDETTKATAIETLRNAAGLLTKANDFTAKAAEFRQLSNDAPQLLGTIRDELNLPPINPTVTVPEGTTLQQLEQTIAQVTASLQASRQLLSELQAETARRDEQRTALTERLVKVRQEILDLQVSGAPSAKPDTAIEVIDAQFTLYQASIIVREQEVKAIESEITSYDARRELLPARKDRAQRRATEAQALVESWQSVIATRRQLEAEQAVVNATKLRREAARQHPVLKEFADESVFRAKSLAGTQSTNGNNNESYAQRLVRARTNLDTLKSRYASIQSRLNASGLNRATGLLLRHQYETIPELSELRKDVASTQSVLEDLDYSLIELQEERDGAGDIDLVAQALLAQMPIAELGNDRSDVLQVARELASARRDILDKLISQGSNNFTNLVELNAVLRETSEVAQSYQDYIEERILWVRSVASDHLPKIDEINGAIQWVIAPSKWQESWEVTKLYIITRWFNVFIGCAFLLLLWLISIRSCSWLTQLGERVSRYTSDSFRYTIYAFLLTMIIAAPIATTLLALGLLLRAPEDQVDIALAIGSGLYAAAFFLYPLAFFRHLLRPKGLAISHFRWSKDSAQPIRKNLRWFIPLIVPLVLLVTAIDIGGDESANASLGRILFTVELFVLTVFLHRVLRPTGAVLGKFIELNTNGWIYRLRYVWYLLAVTLPLFFAIFSWLGFHYTALQLQSRLERSLILTLILVVVNDILHRWLYVARRRVAVEDAKRRRAQAIADAESKQGNTEVPTPAATVIDEDKVDLPALSEQSRQLFRTAIAVSAIIGLFLIWAQALPALRMFDRVQVWPSVEILEVSSEQDVSNLYTPDPPKEASSQSDKANPPLPMPSTGMAQSDKNADAPEIIPVVSITIADIGISIVILIATLIAFRNIPGLIEIVVLQRLPLDAGSRYALSTVIRYLISVIGVMIAFQVIGISWSNVQWLAAALTFGLAFGLQEIFANFVSGLIILAERPIRLGDTVTVGGVSGTVMRIRMRATTISDWDRKELVIPNKTFITGDVINWTLTDPILRVKVGVGVSYSSDIKKVESLLMKIAKKNPTVLETPEPSVLFKEFGDSTLNFELRVFIPHIEYFVPVRHELHSSIYNSFREAGIEIAFPQRDLHVRSIGDLSKLIEHEPKPNDTQNLVSENPVTKNK